MKNSVKVIGFILCLVIIVGSQVSCAVSNRMRATHDSDKYVRDMLSDEGQCAVERSEGEQGKTEIFDNNPDNKRVVDHSLEKEEPFNNSRDNEESFNNSRAIEEPAELTWNHAGISTEKSNIDGKKAGNTDSNEKTTIVNSGTHTGDEIKDTEKNEAEKNKAENNVTDNNVTENNETRPQACEHDFQKVYWPNEPTCTKDGAYTMRCKNCGAEDGTGTHMVPALEHDFISKELQHGNCLDCTMVEYTCTTCGFSYVDTFLEENEHEWTEGVAEVWNEETHSIDQVVYEYCARCFQQR